MKSIGQKIMKWLKEIFPVFFVPLIVMLSQKSKYLLPEILFKKEFPNNRANFIICFDSNTHSILVDDWIYSNISYIGAGSGI